MIREYVPGSHVLDLFAGSGAFGIEALSRGSASAVFVDNNLQSIRAIKLNLASLEELKDVTQVLKLDALKAISGFSSKNKRFDIIFLDPPYHKDLAKNTLIKIKAYDILSERGFVVAEHSIKDVMPEITGGLTRVKQRKYGDTVISFYKK